MALRAVFERTPREAPKSLLLRVLPASSLLLRVKKTCLRQTERTSRIVIVPEPRSQTTLHARRRAWMARRSLSQGLAGHGPRHDAAPADSPFAACCTIRPWRSVPLVTICNKESPQ